MWLLSIGLLNIAVVFILVCKIILISGMNRNHLIWHVSNLGLLHKVMDIVYKFFIPQVFKGFLTGANALARLNIFHYAKYNKNRNSFIRS